MSIIVTTPAKIATLSAATRKAFNAVQIESIVHGAIFREGVEPSTAVRPSDIRMTSAAANAALGGRMTPQSFVQGLIFACARWAHGNQTDISKLPAGSVIALEASFSTLKKGAGCSALVLEHAAIKGIEALLALPAPAKKVATTPAVLAAPVAPVAPALNLIVLKAGIARRSESSANDCDEEGYSNPHNASAQATADSKAASAAALAASAAAIREIAAEQFEKEVASSATALVTSVTARRDAEQIAREIAQVLGFKLVRIPVKKVA